MSLRGSDPTDGSSWAVPHILSGNGSMPTRPSGLITFLFTDVEGSTRRWEAFPDSMAEAIALHDRLLRTAIESRNGYIFKTLGDAFCAAFASPEDALLAALDCQRAVAGQDWSAVQGLAVRAAIHTGTAQERSDDYFGPTLSRVARLLSIAHGGQVLVSRALLDCLWRELPGGASVRDLGEHRLKDLSTPEHVYQLVASGLAVNFPPLVTTGALRHNLPQPGSPLVGREAERATAIEMLQSGTTRLLTLTGPGGSGKTRLALDVAAGLLDQFADGVIFVALAQLVDSALVIPTIAGSIGLPEQPGRRPLDVLKDYLRNKSVLFVLDNFEQVMDGARVVAELLGAAPGLKVVVTSRSVLRLRGEREIGVPPLAVPSRAQAPDSDILSPAVRLFLLRAEEAGAGLALAGPTGEAVAEICRRLDGLPLAIELAAARLRALSPPALLARLDQRLPLLVGGARDLDPRQQTMRAAIGWSYDLLTGPQQALFRRLSVFAGGFNFATAEAVCAGTLGADGDLLTELLALLESSMLVREEADGEPRFRMLETIREYGLEQLEASGEADDARSRHASAMLELTRTVEPWLFRGSREAWMVLLDRDLENVRAAFAWSCDCEAPAAALEMAANVFFYCHFRGHLMSELRAWLERALSLPGVEREEFAELRSRALVGSGAVSFYLGDFGLARERLEAAVTRAKGQAASGSMAAGLCYLGLVNLSQGNSEAALPLFQRSSELTSLPHDLAVKVWNLFLMGDIVRRRAPEEARSLYERSLALARSDGDDWCATFPIVSSAQMALEAGDYAEARALAEEGVRLRRRLGNGWTLGIALASLGDVARCEGDWAAARESYLESLELFRALGATSQLPWGLQGLGFCAVGEGSLAIAYEHFRESVSLAREASDRKRLAVALIGLAAVALRRGHAGTAGGLLRTADATIGTEWGTLSRADELARDAYLSALEAAGGPAAAGESAAGPTLSVDEALRLAERGHDLNLEEA
jgi:predicted ATPase/class 3 adenylate cyclase